MPLAKIDETLTQPREIPKEKYISPEKQQKIIEEILLL